VESSFLRKLREQLFHNRSYTPLPFLAVMLWQAHPTTQSFLTGVCICLWGELTRFWGVAYAGSLTRVTTVGAPEVMMAGPYAHVRNPLYIGNMLMYVGIGVMSNAMLPWLPMVAVAFFIFQYWMIVSLEEEFLEKEFGAGFLEYKKNVPRFIPRLSRYESLAQADQHPRWLEALRSERRTLQALGVVTLILLVLWYRG